MNIDHSKDNKDGTILKPTTAYKTLAQEIKETLQAIQNDPSNPTNYLHAGKFYYCEGKQKECIFICEQGLQNVLPSDHLILQQQLELAKTRLERRVDFVTRCPYEIVHNIIGYVDLTTAVHCIDVARVWRKKFLDHPGVWKSFTPDVTGKQRKLSQLLQIISKNVKSLYIHTRPERLKKHFGIFKMNDFSNLRSLCISDTVDGGIGNPEINLVKLLYGALPYVSSTLTYLDLSLTTQEGAKLSIFRVLSICRKLKSAKFNINRVEQERPSRYYRGEYVDPSTNSVGLARMEQEEFAAFEFLTKIKFTFRSIYPHTIWSLLGELLPFMPRLKSLNVFYYKTPNAYTYLDSSHLLALLSNNKSCPELDDLRVTMLDNSGNKKLLLEELEGEFDYDNDDNDDNSLRDQQRDRMTNSSATTSTGIERANNNEDNNGFQQLNTATSNSSDNNNSGNCVGFRRLILDNLYSTGFIRSRLEKSSDTLRTLSTKLTISSTVFTPQETLYTLPMHNLSTLHISQGHISFYFQQLPDILQRLHSLESLYLGAPYRSYFEQQPIFEPMRLVSAITQRNKLIRLGFEGFGINALDKSFFEPLTEYYSNVITQEQELTATSSSSFGSCGLKSLQIIYCHGLTSKALQHVAKMKTLQKLTIILSPLNTHTKKNILSSNLSANPIDGFTRELTAGGEEKVLPLLSYLELVNVILSDQAIQDIIACKSLKTLLVEQARGFSKTGERLLKKHIESLSSNNI